MADSYYLKKSIDWKNKFFESLFPVDENIRNVIAADDLKFNNRPNSIFKFRGIREPLFEKYLDEIKNDTTWLSRPDQLNDPYECFFKGDFQRTLVGFLSKRIPEIGKIVSENFIDEKSLEKPAERLFQYLFAKRGEFSKENLEFIQKLLENKTFDSNKEFMNNTVKIGCFSERNDSIPMWAHYADKYTGFCIEYDTYSWSKESIRYLFPIIYGDEIVDVTKELFDGIEGWGIKPTILKSSDWSYEKEWRFIRTTPANDLKGILVKFFPVKGIYLGTKILDENKDRIMKVSEMKKIPVYRMRLSESKFAFEPYQ